MPQWPNEMWIVRQMLDNLRNEHGYLRLGGANRGRSSLL